jgi:Txe/YoeB family toxin of Txe-Axe toxin-antitoxin module
MENSTAGKRVVMREAKTWKSRVNAITRLVYSRFDRSRLAVLTCRAYNRLF